MASDERTEAPSVRRLEDMRSKGQVVHSMDLTNATGLLVSLYALQTLGGDATYRMLRFMEQTLAGLSPMELSEKETGALAIATGNVMLSAVLPIFILLPVVAIAITVIQTGPVFTAHSMKPDLGRLNLITALQRMFSVRSLVELVKSLIKVGVVTFFVYRMFVESTNSFLTLGGGDLRSSLALLVDLSMRLGFTAAGTLLVLAAVDYGYQRWEFQRSARMSKDDLRDEARQNEGSPQVRQRIRALQGQLARGRMMQAVPTADVVITNPTHLAVALSYRGEEMVAPVVVAKGADHVAARIREIARANGVPMVENKPLAQALFHSVDIGREIPATLFQAVAEVLAYIYRLRSRGSMREAGYGTGA